MVQSGAGARSRFSDDALQAAGGTMSARAREAITDADILLKVRRPGLEEVKGLKPGAIVAAMLAHSMTGRAGCAGSVRRVLM